MDEWNPLETAYNDVRFNSYEKGPGKYISSFSENQLSQVKEKQDIRLFITNIPPAISEKALCNLFSRVGVVKSAAICKNSESKPNFGFISYMKSDEAGEAISRFNNLEFDRYGKIRVQLSMSREERDARNTEFHNKYNEDEDEFESETKTHTTNKLKIDKSKLITREEIEKMDDTPAPSMVQPKIRDISLVNFCMVCNNIGNKACKICKNEWYCSKECQRIAWPNHKLYCLMITQATEDMEAKFDFYLDDLIGDVEEVYIPEDFFTKKCLLVDTISTHTNVIVTHVISESEFYVNKMATKRERYVLQTQMNLYFNGCNLKANFVPQVDELCACAVMREKTTVGNPFGWRRVYIKECISDSKFKVFDLDCGFTYCVHIKHLRRMTSNLLKVPAQAVLCILCKKKSSTPLEPLSCFHLTYPVGVKAAILDDIK